MAKKQGRKSSRTVRHSASKKASKKPSRRAARVSRAGGGGGGAKAIKPGPKPAASGGGRPSTLARDRAIELAEFAHKTLLDMMSGIPDDKACAQVEGNPNHKLWTIGHMARSAEWFANMIDGKPLTLPASWEGLFGMGSKPTGDASQYPGLAEVRAAYDAAWARLIGAVRALNDAELAKPPTGETGGFLKDKLDSLNKCAWHEGWHLGQISLLRKALGGTPMMG